jgi:glycine/D-amino acid oxidase-like deaminating enzyme
VTWAQLSGVKGALSSFTFTAAHLWPYKMVMHLLQSAVNKGANLQTRTPVTSVSDEPFADGSWIVETGRGSVKAKTVVFATNGYTAKLAPQFKDHIVPVRGICSRIVTPKAAAAPPFLPYTYSIRYGPSLYDYLIPRADGSIIVGGARTKFWSDPSHWYNIWDDSKLIEPAKTYFDNLMQRTFIGWENSQAYTDKVWTGSKWVFNRDLSPLTLTLLYSTLLSSTLLYMRILFFDRFANWFGLQVMGYSSDFMPYVGDIPGKPGLMVLAGFSGHGMPLILNSAKGIVQMLRHGKKFEETGVPEIWRVTEQRLASKQNDIIAPKL